MNEFLVERVDPEDTLALRQQVLRPHQTFEELRLAGDPHPDAGHFAVRIRDGEVVGTAVVWPERPPWPSDESVRAWRLRGMATAEGWRGRGVGSSVLAAVLDHVAARGGGLLWCNARVPAVAFYERAGFRTRGEQWDEPAIGLHIAMTRSVRRVD
jgi:GNAT superfamily N-acetyltransferase